MTEYINPFTGNVLKRPNIFRRLRRKLLSIIRDLVSYRRKAANVIVIPTLAKREYCDPCEKLLHVNFAILTEFIEVELASWQTWKMTVSQWRKKGFSYLDILKYKVFGVIRSEKLGKEYLAWEKRLTKTSPEQAKCAAEKEKLYNWWKHERPARKDSGDVCGLTAFYDKNRSRMFKSKKLENGCYEMYDELTPKERKQHSKLLDKSIKIDVLRDKEDMEMTIRLIKIRQSIWT